jgi:hypothetical protein
MSKAQSWKSKVQGQKTADGWGLSAAAERGKAAFVRAGCASRRLRPWLPLRAICNLENPEGVNSPTLGPQRRLAGALGANLGLFSFGWGRAGRVESFSRYGGNTKAPRG